MNKFLIVGLVICGGIGLAWQSSAMSRSNKGYRIEFTGKPGAKMSGVVGWRKKNDYKSPTHMDKTEGSLPYAVDLNLPAGTMVTATGYTLGQGDVTVKIYHNGVECGKSLTEGTAALPGKVCSP
jgi:hypothetical protein